MEVRAGDKRVLLADDEESVRESLGWLLKFDHFEVVSAAGGHEALECFRQDAFDLVITDYSMPLMNGDELAVQIRRIKPSQPILMITAYAHTTPGPGNPVDAILTKPFAINDFRNIVRMLISGAATATAECQAALLPAADVKGSRNLRTTLSRSTLSHGDKGTTAASNHLVPTGSQAR